MPRTSDTTRAHRTRAERADILQGLEQGTVYIVDLIYDPDPCVQAADLYPVLLRVPGLGRSGIKQACQRARVWPHEKLEGLTEDEKLRLVTCLPARVKK